MAVKLTASVGHASLAFDGMAQDFVHLNGLDGAHPDRWNARALFGRHVFSAW